MSTPEPNADVSKLNCSPPLATARVLASASKPALNEGVALCAPTVQQVNPPPNPSPFTGGSFYRLSPECANLQRSVNLHEFGTPSLQSRQPTPVTSSCLFLQALFHLRALVLSVVNNKLSVYLENL